MGKPLSEKVGRAQDHPTTWDQFSSPWAGSSTAIGPCTCSSHLVFGLGEKAGDLNHQPVVNWLIYVNMYMYVSSTYTYIYVYIYIHMYIYVYVMANQLLVIISE